MTAMVAEGRRRASAAAGHDRPTSSAPASPLDASPATLPGIGPRRAAALAAAGVTAVRHLLLHLPFRYEDRATVAAVGAALPGDTACFEGELVGMRRIFGRRRGMVIVRGLLRDATGELPVVWFNQPYLASRIEAGRQYRLHGTVRATRRGAEAGTGGGRELVSPSCEPAERTVHAGRIVPVYGALGDLGPELLRRLLAPLADLDLPALVDDPVPPLLRARHGLPSLGEALRELHAPAEGADAAVLTQGATPAHARLVYGELLGQQLAMALRRRAATAVPKPHRYQPWEDDLAAWQTDLPFALTAAQQRVLTEIARDLAAPAPMLRLLQGDVGSGKTVVAALAVRLAAASGLQAAIMAPTELLAEQLYRTLRRLLPEELAIARVTASNDLAVARAGLASGEVPIAVGTQALLSEGTTFRRLALVVVDEQHRFGVAQRARLQAKGERPDLLVMTATPIPRSLALTAYGDLELSLLDALPPGRSPITTELAAVRHAERVYRRLAAALAAGERGYVVLPRIDESENVASVAARAAEIGERVAPAPWAVVHGRMGAVERDARMAAFAAGDVRLLVATTLVEVGIDVPQATWMVIESAERFGLAQLHQLRGRIGRGSGAATCVALHGKPTPAARDRLAAFATTRDGFRLAELDLVQRGPGEVLGLRQAGSAGFRFARLPEDLPWLERAREDAAGLLAADEVTARRLAAATGAPAATGVAPAGG